MNTKVTELAKQARVLPLIERAHLVDALIESMLHTEHEISDLWAMEAQDRVEAINCGDMVLEDEPRILDDYRMRKK